MRQSKNIYKDRKEVSKVKLPTVLLMCLTIISLSIWALSCDDAGTDGDTAGTYSGTVTDSVTGLPIDSAMISLRDTSGVSVYTDSTGAFESVALGDNVRIFARKDGYETRYKDVTLGENSQGLVFELPATTK